MVNKLKIIPLLILFGSITLFGKGGTGNESLLRSSDDFNYDLLSGKRDYLTPITLEEGEQIYKKGKVFLNAGVHLGVYRYGYGTGFNAITPMIPLTASVEVCALDFIGIGGYFGFATRSYEYSYTDWDPQFGYHTDVHKRRYTYTSFGAKGAFHVIPFLNKTFNFDHNLDGTKYDLYIAHYVGVRLERSKWVNEDKVDDDVDVDVDNELDPVIMNPAIGARYMFSGFFGAYAEVGYGHFGGNDLNVGLTLRF